MKKQPEAPENTPVLKVEVRRADVVQLVMDDELLRRSALVRAMADDAKAVLKMGTGRRYRNQATVFAQADPGASLFLVLNGEARLFARNGADTVELGAAGKGDVFGEDGVLGESPVRTFSAVALGEVDAVELPREAIIKCGSERPALLSYLDEVRVKRQKARDELSDFLGRW